MSLREGVVSGFPRTALGVKWFWAVGGSDYSGSTTRGKGMGVISPIPRELKVR